MSARDAVGLGMNPDQAWEHMQKVGRVLEAARAYVSAYPASDIAVREWVALQAAIDALDAPREQRYEAHGNAVHDRNIGPYGGTIADCADDRAAGLIARALNAAEAKP